MQSERTLYDQSFEDNPVYRRIFERLPQHIANSFSREQREAIYWASSYQRSEHRVALRRQFSFFGARYYLAVFFGKDRRRKTSEVDQIVMNGLREPWTVLAVRWLLRSLVVIVLIAIGILAILPLRKVITSDFKAEPAHYFQFLRENPSGD
ncbi:MAG: hypothetical protein NW216_04925 [Hyphomicrobium sp.]|nr:hypothetical protein [Hyphomicrobium sp.]